MDSLREDLADVGPDSARGNDASSASCLPKAHNAPDGTAEKRPTVIFIPAISMIRDAVVVGVCLLVGILVVLSYIAFQ